MIETNMQREQCQEDGVTSFSSAFASTTVPSTGEYLQSALLGGNKTLQLEPLPFLKAFASDDKPYVKPAPTKTQHSGTTTASSSAVKSKFEKKYCRQASLDKELSQLAALARAASQGDRPALDRLRVALDNSHAWRRIADLQLKIETQMAEHLAPDDLLQREVFLKRASELRSHLSGDGSSLAVRLAVSRVVACWVFVQFVEHQLLKSGEIASNVKLLEQAERKVETAMRTLALATKLEMQLKRASVT